ncbi:DUF1073 domain-containing protein [Laribacter hongkongensis]|uniref:anti-CBASS protein Acb1 family protein n=1 Tax=Laribacter hongkongensis TaxID=168471 RepID=UPI001EFE8491|nr:anti-CBASS Acb1 family protein [Laribacter hongkongensis]MCG9064706.1 DUF1073 domain-containing protein [Laribacter hongkongensis]
MVATDGLQSMAMRLGGRQREMSYARVNLLTDQRNQLDALWFEDWCARKICDKKSRDMTRRWRTVKSNDTPAAELERFERLERRLNVREVIRQAHQWASLYGTGAIILVGDGQDPTVEFGEDERLVRLVALDRHSISASTEREQNVLSPVFGEPVTYTIKGMQEIHRSRVILVRAVERPPSDAERLWGISDLEGVIEAVKRFDMLSLNVGDLVTESKVDVFKIQGFANKIAAGFENEIIQLISSIQAIKSTTNSVVVDGEIEYEQKELTFTGLKDLLVEFRNTVAGAADMPLTVLFGQSAAGFASGQEDITNYHESIHGLQESRLRHVFDRLDPILARMLWGKTPDDWWFEFPPLTELTAEQRANVLNTTATACGTLLDRGVLREDQILSELKQSELFDNVTEQDVTAARSLAGSHEEDPYGFAPITGIARPTDPTKPAVTPGNAQQANRGVVPAAAA